MSNPKRILDIPGYYYDIISRRYYRQDPLNPKPQIFTSTQTENVLPESVKNPRRSVINILKRRETGFGKHCFENAVISSKSTNLFCVETKYCVNRCQTCEEVEFLKGGEKSLFVEYSSTLRAGYYLEEKRHCFSPKSNTNPCFYGNFPGSYSTVDLIESTHGGNFLLIIVSNSIIWKIVLQAKYDRNFNQRVYNSPEPIWCCAKSDFSNKVAFGERNNVILSTLNCDGYHEENKIPVQGEVRSAAFNKQGNLLFTGRHTGHIGNMDLRINGSVFYEKLYLIGIDETILLYDENYLICGAFDGMICKVDLRMRKPVCEYLGHMKTPRKLPFSICEPNHLLCASGSDNVTRLWNLSDGGEPLKSIKPRVDGAPCRSWLVSDGYKFLIYLFQKDHMYIYNNV